MDSQHSTERGLALPTGDEISGPWGVLSPDILGESVRLRRSRSVLGRWSRVYPRSISEHPNIPASLGKVPRHIITGSKDISISKPFETYCQIVFWTNVQMYTLTSKVWPTLSNVHYYLWKKKNNFVNMISKKIKRNLVDGIYNSSITAGLNVTKYVDCPLLTFFKAYLCSLPILLLRVLYFSHGFVKFLEIKR